MIDFKTQLDLYITILTRSHFKYLHDSSFEYDRVFFKLEARMFRELKRTYDKRAGK